MSVDFFDCKVCEESVCECGEFVGCSCGRKWCSEECAEVDDYEKHHCKKGLDTEDNDCEEDCWNCDSYEEEETCKYCREEDFEDWKLLIVALEKLGITREKLIEGYKKSKK